MIDVPDPRKTACDILHALSSGKATLDSLISETFDPVFQSMSRRDRNFTYALVYGVLRTRGRLDWIIHQFSKNGIEKIDAKVLQILRSALFQIFFMSRIPPSAAVNTAVTLSKKTSPPWVAGFVNGLLRSVIRSQKDITWPDRKADPLLWLSVEQSFPVWLLKRWADRMGFAQTEALCRFYNTIPPLCIRTNTLTVTREEVMTALAPEALEVTAAPYAPEGILVHGLKANIQELDAFQKGWFQVQDEAAQLVSHAVSPAPGGAVLDACAGLGGKTGHLAQLMNNTGTLAAMDSHAGRLEKLAAQMARLGVTITRIFRHDLNQGLDQKHHLIYDQVLVDAPCSGTGVIRRNPDTRWSVAPEDFARYRKNQLQYLNNASVAVRPGGMLVYAVCTIEPEETDDVVSGFINIRPEYQLASFSGIMGAFPFVQEGEKTVRIIPHVHNMDGFFIAAFKKGE